MIGEIFITRAFIVSIILYILSTNNFKEKIEHLNRDIYSSNKEIIKKAKNKKKIEVIFLIFFSIYLIFVLINVTHCYFYKSSHTGVIDKNSKLDRIAIQFYRTIDTKRIIRYVD